MAGLYFSVTTPPREKLACIGNELSFVPSAWSWISSADNSGLALCRVDERRLWGPYEDLQTGTVVALVGRIAFDANEWDEILSSPGRETGLVCREIWRRYRAHGPAALEKQNGAFNIFIWDRGKRSAMLVTDRLGAIPMFIHRAKNPQALQICSHPDILARHALTSRDWDLVTMAEQLRCGTSVHPYTYYRDIVQLDAGSIYQWDLRQGGLAKKRYWEPRFDPIYNRKNNAEDLANALAGAVKRRTHSILGKAGLFLSGGSDSRIALFASSARSNLTAVTLCDDVENMEAKTAKRLCDRAGVKHLLWTRDMEYYPRNAAEVMRIAAGMWNFVDGHYQGFHPQIMQENFGVVLTGCYADYLFKGVALNKRQLRIGKLHLPYNREDRFQLQYYLSHKRIAEEWKVKVEDRLWEELSDLKLPPNNPETKLQVEARRMFPFSREVDAAARSTLWRCLPWDPIFCDRDVIDVYQRIPDGEKLNGKLFGEAVSMVCAEARDIPNANSGVNVAAGPLVKTAKALSRHVFETIGRHPSHRQNVPGYAVVNGSWPNWRYLVANSPVMDKLWNSSGPEARDIISELLGWDPWSRDLREWARIDSEYFCRIFSLAVWLHTTAEHNPQTLLGRSVTQCQGH